MRNTRGGPGARVKRCIADRGGERPIKGGRKRAGRGKKRGGGATEIFGTSLAHNSRVYRKKPGRDIARTPVARSFSLAK